MRITVRLNDTKDSDIIEVIHHIPQSYLSEVTRKALRKFFGLPEKQEVDHLKEFMAHTSNHSILKQNSHTVPVVPETKPTEPLIMKQQIPNENSDDLRTKFRRRTVK